jgi:hypothetical protein
MHVICSSHILVTQVLIADYVTAHYHLLQEILRTIFEVQMLLQHLCDMLQLIKSSQQRHGTENEQFCMSLTSNRSVTGCGTICLLNVGNGKLLYKD